jgi:hypothetical protein
MKVVCLVLLLKMLHLNVISLKHNTVTCPICSKSGLLEAGGTDKIGKKLIVCENEFYKHWTIGGNHFLTRTELGKIEDVEIPFGELVLN